MDQALALGVMAAAVLFADRWARGGRGVSVVLAVGVAALVAIAGVIAGRLRDQR